MLTLKERLANAPSSRHSSNAFTLDPLHALDRQPNADYRARRQALAAKTGAGVVILFAPMEAEGPNDLYGFRQNDDFFYLTGWTEPGAAILIAAASEASGINAARPYTEILFLPAHNRVQERWTGPKLGADNPDASKVTGFDHVDTLDHLRDVIVPLLPLPRSTVYSDLPRLRRHLRFHRSSRLAQARECFRGIRVVPGCKTHARALAYLQRRGRNRTHPQSDGLLRRSAPRRHEEP